MALVRIRFITCCVAVFSIANTYEHIDKDELITSLMEENKAMKLKLTEINLGLKQICQALFVDPLEASLPASDNNTTRDKRTDGNKDNDEIKLISIESRGIEHDTLRLTVQFETSVKCTVDWHQLFNIGNGLFWTKGNVTRIKITQARFLYTCNVEFHDITLTYNINARIHNTKYSVTFDINIPAAATKGEEMLRDPDYQITDFSPLLTLPQILEGNFEFVITVQDKTNETGNDKPQLNENGKSTLYGKDDIRLHYTWINTTSEPSVVSNLDGIGEIGVTSSVKDNNLTDYAVTLEKEYVENGGLFQFDVPQPLSNYRYTDGLTYGVFIEIVRQENMSYVPPGVLVVYSDAQTTWKASTSVSVFCLAMGNPRPHITVYRRRNRQKVEMEAELLTPDAVTSLKYVTVQNVSRKGDTFICKATNGKLTRKSEMRIERYENITFDERKTGVMKNATSRTVASCKVYGNPVPELTMRLGSTSGPNLLNMAGNFTSKTQTKGKSVKADVAFSFRDNRYDVIYCVAVQSGLFYAMVDRKIVIYPYVYENVISSERFRFYQSVQDANVFNEISLNQDNAIV